MYLFAGIAFVILLLSHGLWQESQSTHRTTVAHRVVEFLCVTPWLSWTITVWVGMITWVFFIGDNESLFQDFYHYGTFALGTLVAAILAFRAARKPVQLWAFSVGLSLVMQMLIMGSGYLPMPPLDGFTARWAAERAASRVPLPSSYTLVPTSNPQYGGAFSSFDRTYLFAIAVR